MKGPPLSVAPTDNVSLEELDRQCVMHPLTNLKEHASGERATEIMDGGRGIRVRNRQGRELIDGFAALYCVNVGYGRTEIAEAIYQQARKLAYFHTYRGHSNEPLIQLSDRVLRLAPPHMSRVYYGLSGSDANETQVKIAWYYNNVLGRTEKKKIIARQRGYHGSSVMAGSLTGIERFHKAFDLPMPRVLHTTAPHHYWGAEPGMSEIDFSAKCAADLDGLIEAEGPETVAAFIAEPVVGTGGIVPPPEGYWPAIQAVLAKHDVLLIADEVVCGFGRVGANFGSDLYGVSPDLMSIAKGLTSAYVPLSGVIVGNKVWQVLERGSDEYGPVHPRLHLLRTRPRRGGRSRQSRYHRTRRSDRERAPHGRPSATTTARIPRGSALCRRGARRRPACGGRVRRRPRTQAPIRSRTRDRPAHRHGLPPAWLDRSQYACRRYDRVFAAAGGHRGRNRRDRGDCQRFRRRGLRPVGGRWGEDALACDRFPTHLGAVHAPPQPFVKGVAPMHRAAIVPHHHVVGAPTMRPGKSRLCRMRPQFVQQSLAFGEIEPNDEGVAAAAQVERGPSRLRVAPHRGMACTGRRARIGDSRRPLRRSPVLSSEESCRMRSPATRSFIAGERAS